VTTGLIILDADGFPSQRTTLGYGDVVLKTLFSRIHNFYGQALIDRSKGTATPNQVYNEGRRWNIAFHQSITMYEYASILFNGPLPPYQGYNSNSYPVYYPEIGPIIVHYPYSEFTGKYLLKDETWTDIADGSNAPMMLTYYAWQLAKKFGPESFVRGSIAQIQHNVDLYFSDDIRKNAYASATSDAFARLFARAREVGLPLYNEARVAYGLPKKTSFQDISPNLEPGHIALLQKFYPGGVDTLDSFIGMHAEWTNTTHMGELMTTIYKPYWIAARDGDRFWFEGAAANFTAAEIVSIRNTKISDLLMKFFPSLGALPCSAFYYTGTLDCPSAAPNTKCPNSEPNTVQYINSQVILKWNAISTNAVTFTVAAPNKGYIATGIPATPGKMLGTIAFIGMVFPNGTATVGVYNITVRSPCFNGNQGVCPTSTSPYTISNVSGSSTSAGTTITYTVTGITPRMYDIVGSYGTKNVLEYHGGNKGVTQITISAPTTPAPTTPAPTVVTTTPAPCPTVAKCTCSSASSVVFSAFVLFLSVFVMLF
jgi:hypothetical protein